MNTMRREFESAMVLTGVPTVGTIDQSVISIVERTPRSATAALLPPGVSNYEDTI
jgi:isopentenyl diphosphate isomerase/L-lactate dehydrogenase-like FMN-dependent dehydrogenase